MLATFQLKTEVKHDGLIGLNEIGKGIERGIREAAIGAGVEIVSVGMVLEQQSRQDEPVGGWKLAEELTDELRELVRFDLEQPLVERNSAGSLSRLARITALSAALRALED